ncbi:MAG: cyclic nucleotide-binding domain-containing protein [Actinomycetota bacterium]
MARRSDLVSHLKNIELFAGLSKGELGKVAAIGTERSFPAGTTIVEQGEMGRTAYVLLDGTAVVRRGNRKVAELEVGAPVGELSLLDHGPRTAYVIAETDVSALELSAKEFASLLEEFPKVSSKLLAALAGRVRDLDRKVFG